MLFAARRETIIKGVGLHVIISQEAKYFKGIIWKAIWKRVNFSCIFGWRVWVIGFVNKFLSCELSNHLFNEILYNLNIYTENSFELTYSLLAIKNLWLNL